MLLSLKSSVTFSNIRILFSYLHRERLTKARVVASVLFEVLDTVSRAAGVQVLFMRFPSLSTLISSIVGLHANRNFCESSY